MQAVLIHTAFERTPRAVATIDIADMKGDEALEYVFRVTQNLEGSWSKGPAIEWNGEIHNNPDFNPNITLLVPLPERDGNTLGLRSTSVDDQILLGNKKYRVAYAGFEALEEEAYYGA